MLEWIGWLFLVWHSLHAGKKMVSRHLQNYEVALWFFVCAGCGLAAIGLAPFKVVLS